MTELNLSKPPFPWFGGKSQAAPLVWKLLGDPSHYCEPFFGGGAVLLNRPHPCNRADYSETVNDIDGFICNFWRAVQWYPEETAKAASWPVIEADKSARQLAILRWREAGAAERLAGDATWCDPVIAGWWAWAVCVQIGGFSGTGPWWVDPTTGRIIRREKIGEDEPGIVRSKPHLGDDGRGINHPGLREGGITRAKPFLGHGGRGVNHPGLRESGIKRSKPHISSGGQGINHPGLRESGVRRDRPHISNGGTGVIKPSLRLPGVLDPVLPGHGGSRLDDTDWGQYFHDRTMLGLIRWFRYLSARLRHVRVLNGDWSRVCTDGALRDLNVRTGKGYVGVFLDPPYPKKERAVGLYLHDPDDVAYKVRDWCLGHTNTPWLRIVLAGFEGDFGKPLVEAGWKEYEWFEDGWLRGGYAKQGKGTQQHRERLWASPNCDDPDASRLF